MRRALVTFLVVLVVLGVGGVLADNYVRGRAEDRVAAALRSRLDLSQKPGVTLGGFPFSLAFVTRTVPNAQASAGSVPITLSGHKVNVTGVLADSQTIRLVADQVSLARVSVTGVLDYGALSELTGGPVSYAGDGRLKLGYTATVAGVQLTIGVSAMPEVDGGAIRLTGVKLESGGSSLPLSQTQLNRLVKPIPLKLPKGIQLTALAPSEGGVAVAATATDLTFQVA